MSWQERFERDDQGRVLYARTVWPSGGRVPLGVRYPLGGGSGLEGEEDLPDAWFVEPLRGGAVHAEERARYATLAERAKTAIDDGDTATVFEALEGLVRLAFRAYDDEQVDVAVGLVTPAEWQPLCNAMAGFALPMVAAGKGRGGAEVTMRE